VRIPATIFLLVSILWVTAVALTAAGLSSMAAHGDFDARASAGHERLLLWERLRGAVLTAGARSQRLFQAESDVARAEHGAAALSALSAAGDTAAALRTGVPKDERAAVTEIEALLRPYVREMDRLVRSGLEGRAGQSRAALEEMADRQQAIVAAVDLFTREAKRFSVDLAVAAAAKDAPSARLLVLSATGLGLALALAGTVWAAYGGLSRPVVRIAATLDRLAKGEAVRIPPEPSDPEFAGLWRAAEAFHETRRRLRAEADANARLRSDIDRAARIDPLTGLETRARFEAELAGLGAGTPGAAGTALLLIGVDPAGLVDGMHGLGAGDALLAETGRRLANAACGGRAFRVGDEAFGLLAACPERGDLPALAERVAAELGPAVRFGCHEIRPSLRIGAAHLPGDAADGPALAALARHCMSPVGPRTRPVAVFAPGMRADIVAAQTLLPDLATALAAGQIVVHYQPKVAAAGHFPAGFEALVRWEHPEHGLLAPDRFLALANRAGLMTELTRAVLDVVARDVAQWRAAGHRFGRVAVNVSEEVLDAADAVDLIGGIVGRHGIAWSDLTFEVTEDVVLRDGTRLAANLAAVSDRGASISLDDFGTGYASLVHLRRFPIDELKIDRSFIAEIGLDARSSEIVRTLIELGLRTGIGVVAEGVETEEQAAFLRAEGCGVLQGYLVSRPLPFPAATAWLAAERAAGTGEATIVDLDAARARRAADVERAGAI
jgi:predicted signal transduction protein with EAL and GGDEF domain